MPFQSAISTPPCACLLHFAYALRHPAKAFRYLCFRDRIPYPDIARHLPRNPVILEAGAHNGVNTDEIARYWPGAVIHAFEPCPPAAAELRQRTAAHGGRVIVHETALGAKPGRFDLHISGDGSAGACQSSSLRAPATAQFVEFSFVQFGGTIPVDVVTLDEWADQQGIKSIDFLWLDMQGSELDALRGGCRIVRTVRAIHIEVSNVRLYENAPLYPEVKAWLVGEGFRPVVEATFRVMGNVLFVRADGSGKKSSVPFLPPRAGAGH